MDKFGEILSSMPIDHNLKNKKSKSIKAPNEIYNECSICEGRGWISQDKPISDPSFGQINPCTCRTENLNLEKQSQLLRYSNLGHLSRFTFANLNDDGLSSNVDEQKNYHKALQVIKDYSLKPEGWLIISGEHGSGKTHIAAALTSEYIKNNIPAFFIYVPDLLDHLRSTFSPSSEIKFSDIFELVLETPILVLDGLGIENSSPWAQEKLEQILNHRYNNQLSTIITTSRPISELSSQISSKINNLELCKTVILKPWDLSKNLSQGNINPELFKRMNFKTFNFTGNNPRAHEALSLEMAFKAAKEFANDPHGWLTLFGNTGVGKTHLAIAIAEFRKQKDQFTYFAFVPDLLDHLRNTFAPDSKLAYDTVFDSVKNAKLLILDDLGRERSSPWAEEKLFQIIAHRHNGRMPTVITTMIDFTEDGPLQHIRSRVRDPWVGSCLRIEAPDYRSKYIGKY